MAEEHVKTVLCPNCGNKWTGRFEKDLDEALCKTCMIKLDRPDQDKHPDLTIRAGRY
jgi:NMD protein affecting ribosome stability and mRNA decay